MQLPKIASQGVRQWDKQAGCQTGQGAYWLGLVGQPGDPHSACRANEQQQPACQNDVVLMML
jgi:hypothetical protein